jgi:hypothetical protein
LSQQTSVTQVPVTKLESGCIRPFHRQYPLFESCVQTTESSSKSRHRLVLDSNSGVSCSHRALSAPSHVHVWDWRLHSLVSPLQYGPIATGWSSSAAATARRHTLDTVLRCSR